MQNSQSHQSYLALEHAVVTLVLKPGALVTERQLIDIAGHGRTPVREAIQKLAWQGLIIVRPRVGLQIAEIRPGDHSSVMQVRRELEPIAAGLTAEAAEDGQREALGACERAMRACAESGDLAAFFADDKTFDEVLEEACPNKFITAALGPVQTHARRIWYSTANPDRMERSIALHVATIEAIREGRVDAARDTMTVLIDYLSQK